MLKKDINKKYLHECFVYDKQTGDLIWKARPKKHFKRDEVANWNNKRFAGKKVGNVRNYCYRSNTKYRGTRVNNIFFFVHHLVWIFHNDIFDSNFQIDHIDNDGLNNKIENLRLVSQSLNQKNRPLQKSNKTGVNGVNWHKAAKKWQVRVVDNDGNRLDLGRYDDFNEAVKIRKNAEKLYGYLQ